MARQCALSARPKLIDSLKKTETGLMKVALTVVAGPRIGTVMEFSEPRGFIIGRAENADFRLPEDDLYVSRHHVYLEICPPSCRVRDLGAVNPPLLNDKPVQEADLGDGDTLELGYTRFKVAVTGVPAPLPEVRCLTCGKQIDAPPDGDAPTLCPQCLAAKLSAPTPAMIGEMASCAFCDADLSSVANKDGRAEELKNIVVYSCPQCLPYDDHVRGRAIGGFNLVRSLGEGGMGVVYLAHHTLTGRLVALKQIKGLRDEHSVKRFERESMFLQTIVHENIVRCLHTGTHSEGPYFVSEFVPDGDLEQLVEKEGGKLPPDRAIAIITQVLAGVGFLHKKDIVHRDIKPQNILVRLSADKSDVVKLTDFGLAKCHSEAGGVRLTKPKTAMGTLMYMPPEQIKDAAGVRAHADLYAVGVTLYYILTGSYTFDFPTPAEVAELQRQKPEQFKSPEEVLGWIMRANRVKHPFLIILNEDPVPVRDRNASIPKKLADTVDKAVRKDPEKRFGSAMDFQKALRESL
jgi:hypothetical protein